MKWFYCIIFLASILMEGCKSENKETDKMSENEVKEWIASSKWYTALPVKPDSSINQRMFAGQNIKNEKSWNAAFKFLRENNLGELAVGRYDLLDDGTYATVSEYTTKEPDSAKYEVHRKYIDIQYVERGAEYIELLKIKDIKGESVYDEKSDIQFFIGGEGRHLFADNQHFFVFFPEDVHKPCLKVDSLGTVRKIVVKIPWVD